MNGSISFWHFGKGEGKVKLNHGEGGLNMEKWGSWQMAYGFWLMAYGLRLMATLSWFVQGDQANLGQNKLKLTKSSWWPDIQIIHHTISQCEHDLGLHT